MDDATNQNPLQRLLDGLRELRELLRAPSASSVGSADYGAREDKTWVAPDLEHADKRRRERKREKVTDETEER